ncbi:LysR family transcriptional regulator [Aromatoleum evansii]|uniref:LysR family transcriptional regulator n=1 Tax=Aromatoleum evansii TaxID=59406 RepID=A0ABZ1AQN8_AROEV|nr:LysR family transcriptional regulator [Aromatoleum evansii]
MNPSADGDAPLLEVKLLRLFDLLYSTHSVTHAAELLGQSQPTVSIWLARLREQLGDPLFVRTPSGMQPTPRAEALIPIARSALESLRKLATEDAGFEPATAERRFCICMTDASHITLLPQLLAHVRSTAPGVRLEAGRIDATTGERLQSGEADIALGLIPELGAGFYQQVLFTQDWVCLANRHHPRIDGELTLDDYCREGHIGIVSGTGSRILASALEDRGIDRRIVLELPGFLGLAAILSTTDLIVTLPRQTGETLGRTADLRVLPCPFPIPSFTVKQHWHARYHHDAGNRWLRGVCAGLFLHNRTN